MSFFVSHGIGIKSVRQAQMQGEEERIALEKQQQLFSYTLEVSTRLLIIGPVKRLVHTSTSTLNVLRHIPLPSQAPYFYHARQREAGDQSSVVDRGHVWHPEAGGGRDLPYVYH